MKSLLLFSFTCISVCFFYSCNSTPPPTVQHESAIPQSSSSISSKRVLLGTTGFTIELPDNYVSVEKKDTDIIVDYIMPNDTATNHGGGIYIGTKPPDDHAPKSVFSMMETMGVLLGHSVKWVEYKTATYTWKETIVEIEDGKKIQVWCYAENSADFEKLFKTMNSIER